MGPVGRWNWTWEEPRPAPPHGQGAPPDPPPELPTEHSEARRRILRRRRAAAGVALVVVIALLIAALSAGGGHGAGRSQADVHAGARHAAVAPLSAAQQAALADRQENNAIDRVLAYTPAITHGGDKGNEVALTFDDGPGPYTERLVEVLNSLHVTATFFAIGEEERYFSRGTLLELHSGDVVGDHTETHPMMASLSRHEQHEELFEQIARIELLGGPRPRLFRPPYGSFNATTFSELHALRLLMVLWSTDTADYTLPGVHAIVERALAGAHPGAIILMHDAGGDRSETIAALPAIIAGLRKRGLRPVTIPRMMLDDPPPPGQPIPTSLAGD
jgi:peptidoglycan/xylan/chitin deacetylase (PgdA/CDA1 family)